MDAELKAKWIAALRSGEFKQTPDVLQKDDRYCCLGVLASMLGLPTVGTQETTNATYRALEPIIGVSTRLDAAHKNDSGLSFSQIADWLESQP